MSNLIKHAGNQISTNYWLPNIGKGCLGKLFKCFSIIKEFFQSHSLKDACILNHRGKKRGGFVKFLIS